MTETEAFLAEMTPRVIDAETDLHNGDPAKRSAMWSRTEPLTLFGAAMNARGWPEIERTFSFLGSTFADCTSYENEILAAEASGDLAYMVALEHTTASIHGAQPQPYVLRVTTVFRREAGEWKIVHRHGDALTTPESSDAVSRVLALPGQGS